MLTQNDLTRAERLLLWRRRRKLTQAEAAAENGCSRNLYNAWEKGQGEPPLKSLNDGLSAGEQLLVLRRRLGLNQSELGRENGLCRYWIGRLERDEADGYPLVKDLRRRYDRTAR